MSIRLTSIVLIALMAAPLHVQAATPVRAKSAGLVTTPDTTVLPVWNDRSGKVEALLLLDRASDDNTFGGLAPASSNLFGAGARVKTGAGVFQAGIGADSSSGMALLCNASTGLMTLGSLADRCLLASLDATPQDASNPFFKPVQGVRAQARFERPESLFEVSAGKTDFQGTGTDWLSPSAGLVPSIGILGGHFSEQDVSARGKLKLGSNGWVSIGGTLAHARLIPTDGSAGADGQRWNTTSVGVAAGKGRLSGEVIGRVVALPGQSTTANTLGVGVSWLTPWKGKLTIGAEHTTGANALSLPIEPKDPGKDDGTVPYVRYHQDL